MSVLRGKHNITHGMCETRIYGCYRGMLNRYLNSNVSCYKDYGARGITVCDRWLESFENFYEDMGDKPSNEHSLDRIDNSKGYYKENCKWSTKAEQTRNRRISIKNTSGKTGVYWDKKRNKWKAWIVVDKKKLHLGMFDNVNDAISAREVSEKLYWKHIKEYFNSLEKE